MLKRDQIRPVAVTASCCGSAQAQAAQSVWVCASRQRSRCAQLILSAGREKSVPVLCVSLAAGSSVQGAVTHSPAIFASEMPHLNVGALCARRRPSG